MVNIYSLTISLKSQFCLRQVPGWQKRPKVRQSPTQLASRPPSLVVSCRYAILFINLECYSMLHYYYSPSTTITTKTAINIILYRYFFCRILSYFGHIMRRGDDNLETLVFGGGVEGKTARGRSPTIWSDQMKEGSSSSKFHQAVKASMDRDRWRDIIMKVKTSDHYSQ
jgi:hypothetical protein